MKTGNKSWRCSNKKCSAIIETDKSASTLVHFSGTHVHEEMDLKKIQRDNIREECKKEGIKNKFNRPNNIISSSLMENDTEELDGDDLNGFRQAIYRARKSLLPADPKSWPEALEQLQGMEIVTNRQEKFCFVEDGLVILTTEKNLNFLIHNSETILGDGTFYVSPLHSKQLYTIHSFIDGSYYQLIFCFLPNKKTETYIKMFTAIRRLTKGRLNPNTLILDFEKPAHNAATSVFPNIIIRCCRFHLGQNWFKKIVDLGLKDEYLDMNSEIGSWLKLFFGLTFVESELTEEAFLQIMSIAPIDKRCEAFSDYILEFYILPDAMFPPYLWAEAPSLSPRTTNGAESYHRHIKKDFVSPKPSVHLAIDNLRRFQSMTYLKLNKPGRKRISTAQETTKLIIEKYLVMKNDEREDYLLQYLKQIKCQCQPPLDI